MNEYRIPELARKYVEHDMITTHTELPDFPDFRVRLLYTLLSEGTASAEHHELYALVVSLVQMGLDIHDVIDTDTAVLSQIRMRERQLNVLAGDYYSARFYHLLSQAGQVGMVRCLSDAICEINRQKMNLYILMRQMKLTAEEYMAACTELKSGLFAGFGPFLGEAHSPVWPELLAAVSRCDVVMDELERVSEPLRFEGSWGYWHVLEHGSEEEKMKLIQHGREDSFIKLLARKYDLRGQLIRMLKQAVQQFQTAAGQLESDKLTGELAELGESILRPFTAQAAVYNEMR
ncbi:heptaprenyl diphosphate synthase component 1 [Paenibacillus tarimensis]|uniref:heptaprenyl diphosphate synthase component 1 n=1 Tax=Paenibacillus tarimensis TaxID=416012 RepID=UPI001F40D988|nr:heptaprenyl diphosphate synthase component 1 [Paenibacillus tarimensis]MCF2942542.1 heptaprenyl diphosphate synthase component 1 [Paenibacillus tarimensis]